MLLDIKMNKINCVWNGLPPNSPKELDSSITFTVFLKWRLNIFFIYCRGTIITPF